MLRYYSITVLQIRGTSLRTYPLIIERVIIAPLL
nr:MAG TPA: hypothetical protein [Caudoviricetes sp.]